MIRRNLFIILFTLLCHYLNSGSASTNPDQYIYYKYVLLKFPELPNYYEELRGQNTHLESKLSVIDKSEICNETFGHKIVIEPDDDEYTTELRSYDPIIFDELFREEEKPKGVLSKLKAFRSKRKRYVYENASKIRTFLVDGREREENTFVCITIRNSEETQHFDVYFVSDYSYNVNDALNRRKISGRFVFFGNQIYALAEKLPLYHLSQRPSNSTYYRKKNGHILAEKWENDPVCKLDRGRKFRLCTYVCVQVAIECDEKRIEVQEPCTKREFTMEEYGVPLNEWMLTCKISMHSNLFREFFVARSYTDNEVFLFVLMDGKLSLKHVLISVSVVVDKADRELEYLERKESNIST